jgi:acetylornithine deacetylase/succinyl-diaminopimelate desuccinylase-like protein
MPSNLATAGNVIHKELTLRCSVRLAPTQKGTEVNELLKQKLTHEDYETFGAKLEYSCDDISDGFSAPDLPEDIKKYLNEATTEMFGEGQSPTYVGVGGAIPFMEVF